MADPIPSPRRWSPTYQPRRRSKQVPSLSFVPSPVVPRIESQDFSNSLPRRPVDRSPACMSPFRSVRRMKEPFQLRLPTSPASMNAPTPNFPEKPARSPRPRGGHSLRTWRSDQNLKVDIGGLGLLPSPPMTESRPSSAGPESSYFKFEISEPRSATMEPSQRWVGELNEDISEDLNEDLELNLDTDMSEYSEPSTTDKLEHNDEPVVEDTESNEPSEEDLTPTAPESDVDEKLKYQAYYPPDWKNQPRTDVMNVHEAHSELLRHCENDSEQSSPAPESDALHPPSIKSPKSPHSNLGLPPGSSPRPQRSRTATVSSEASWVPSNFSYCERWLQCVPTDGVNEERSPMKEFNNRRKFQIVENDPPMPKLDIIPGAKALEEPVVSSHCVLSPCYANLTSASLSPVRRNQSSSILLDNHQPRWHYHHLRLFFRKPSQQHPTNVRKRSLRSARIPR